MRSNEGKISYGWLLAVVSILWMTCPTSVFAAKHLTKKDEAGSSVHRASAAVPSESNPLHGSDQHAQSPRHQHNQAT